MKMFAFIAAGLVAVSALPVASADAQTRVVRTTTTTTTAARPVHSRTVVTTQTRRGNWHRTSWHHGRQAHWRTVCHNSWRHHHRVRTCNRVRSWY